MLNKQTLNTAFALVLLGGLIGCAFWLQQPAQIPGGKPNIVAPWLASTVLILSLFALVSWAIRGRLTGFLIDERNRISLSRLQLVCWTVLLLGGYWTLALWRVGAGIPGFPAMSYDLWLLLGITSISPLASALILQTKATASPPVAASAPPAVQGALPVAVNPPPANAVVPAGVTSLGMLDKRTDADHAGLMDIFLGEEVDNRHTVDVSRLQQVIFTLLLLVTYAFALGARFASLGTGEPPSYDMPPVDATFVGLLGLSHAAYLTAKGLPKPPSV